MPPSTRHWCGHRSCRNHSSFADTAAGALRYIVAIFVPLSVATAAMAPLIVDLAYVRGAFDQRAAILTSAALVGFAPLLVLTMLQAVLTGAHNARQRGMFLLSMGILNAVLNLVFNVSLGLMIGVAGVALSTSLTMGIVEFIKAWRLGTIEATFRLGGLMMVSGKALLASGIVAIPIALVSWMLPHRAGVRHRPGDARRHDDGRHGRLHRHRAGARAPRAGHRRRDAAPGTTAVARRRAMSPERRLRVMYPTTLQPGGAERQQMLLAEHLPRDRFDVSFVLLQGMTPMADRALELGAGIHVLGAPQRGGLPLPLFATKVARHAASYVAVCRRERFDIVDAWLYLGYSLAALTRPVARVPILVAGRRSLSAFKAGFGPVERAVDALARRSADVIVANSQAVAEDTRRREGIHASRIRVIRNGVAIPPPVDPARRMTCRAAMGVVGDGPVIGCVGTFKRGKGQAAVVAAMAMAARELPDAWLVFVGDGPERAAVERSSADAGLARVLFLGSVPDARPLYDGFDVVVSASDAEGLPNVILEAAAAGLPIAATDAGGTGEVVIDGRTGLLVPCGDTGALAATLMRLVADRDLAGLLGSHAREHVTRAFGVEKFVTETATLYEELHDHHDH